MGARTRAKIGTAEGVKTVRVYSANPKTVDGYNTFIFRRDIARSLSKLAWAPVIDGSRNPVLEGVEIGDRSVRYPADDKRRLIEFVERIADAQKGSIENDDFGHFEITKIFATEVQCHAISTRREIESVSSAAEIARSLIHFVGSPNEEQKRKKPNKYFEYGLAKIRLSDGVYLVMGEVGIRVNKRPYYDQRVVAKFKADSEVSSLHGQTQIGESTFEQVYDNRFRLILQGVELYYKQSPKFSIIIPVYNVAPYLRECLDSVLAQTFTDWEAICVDDGSTDGSGAILDEYAAKDVRFRVIHQKNAGVSASRNAALEVALRRSEWVWFVDSDDAIHPQSLAFLSNVVLHYGDVNQIAIDNVCSNQREFWDFRRSVIAHECRLVDPTRVDAASYRALRRAGWATIHRSCVIASTRFEKFKIGEDVLFTFSNFWKTRKALITNAQIYFYRVRAGSAVTRPPRLQEVEDLHATEIACQRMILKNKACWTTESMQGYFEWNSRFDFYSFANMFLRISNWERTRAIPGWLQLQELNNQLFRLSLMRRIVIGLVRFVPSGRMALVAITLCLRIEYYRGRLVDRSRRLWLLRRRK